jgi:hypothetical protein
MPPVCTNTTNSPANCGACGNKCGAGMNCSAATCQCVGMFLDCAGDAGVDAGTRSCINPKHDKNNCGACGNVCAAMCVNGTCK